MFGNDDQNQKAEVKLMTKLQNVARPSIKIQIFSGQTFSQWTLSLFLC